MRGRKFAALAIVMVACSPDKPISTAPDCTSPGDCKLSASADILTCLQLDSGIYGRQSAECVGGGGCGGTSGPVCVTGLTVQARRIALNPGDGGVAFETTTVDGLYKIELDPGDYEVCCSIQGCPSFDCAQVTISAGARARVDPTEMTGTGSNACGCDAVIPPF